MRRPTASEIFRDPVHVLAFGFGSGLAPYAPGTAGTVVAVPLELALRAVPIVPRIALIVAVIAAGVWICGVSARRLGEHDHPGIVFDEFAGYFVAMLAAPPGWLGVVAGFGFFRFFDIVKPWPIRELDHSIHGGAGIMLDDIVAGLYAAGALYALGLVTG